MLSSSSAPSITASGAYWPESSPSSISRTPDPGAPAWTIEPWFKLISDQFWKEHHAGLWNPYSGYGTPLAAAMQPQPFYPLTILLSLHPTAWTYNLFIIGRLFIAGLLMFAFARLILNFLPALFAATTFMLTGYFIMFLNMPHLSVEVLLPGIFLAFELILRRNSWGSVAFAACVIFISITGGMPESLFLAVAFGCIYFLFRLTATPEFRSGALPRLVKFVAAVALGFGLSAFMLFPFLEFIRISHDTHQAVNNGGNVPGIAADSDLRTTVLYFLPLIFGPVGNSIFTGLSGWTGIRGYWGITPCLFAAAALACCFTRSSSVYPKHLRLLTGFFAISLALMLLKRFGSPLINWIGLLPMADLIVYAKYQEPLMALSVAMLGGIGLSLLIEWQNKPSQFVNCAVAVLVLILVLAGFSLPNLLGHRAFAFVYLLVLLSGICVVAAALFLLNVPMRRSSLTWSFFALLTVELCVNFIVPSFYLFHHLPSAQRSPYVGAPYLDFMQKTELNHNRVFAREGLLYPNWAGAFGLSDVRSLDAIYYRPYINFIRNFLLKPGDDRRDNGDLADRFTGLWGGYTYEFASDIELRFLALSSIKYLISGTEYGAPTKVMGEIVSQHRADALNGFGPDYFQINDRRTALGLFQHPPSHRVSYKTVIDPRLPVLKGIAAIKPDALDKTAGVQFDLEINTGVKVEKLFSTLLNPKQVPADRSGRTFQVNLSQYAGREVELLFSTNPGPNGSVAYAWGGWANLNFVDLDGGEAISKMKFKKVYDKEVRIYEVPDILPRASVFRMAEVLPEDQVLQRLKEPSFNHQDRVILSQESLQDLDPAVVHLLKSGPAEMNKAADISQYDSQHVRIETHCDTPVVLMLNDANYPGWRAYVDGKLAPVVKANYLFRGVILLPGKHVVEFSYEPLSFRLGLMISIGALATLALGGGLSFRRRHRVLSRQAHPSQPSPSTDVSV